MDRNKLMVVMVCIFLTFSLNLKSQGELENKKVLTFEQAKTLLELNSYTVKQFDERLKQKQIELHSARGLFLPKISLGANYTLMSDDISMDMSPVKDAVLPLYESLGKYGNFSGVPNPDPSTSGVLPILPENISTIAVRKKLLEGAEVLNNTNWNKVIQKKQFGVINANFVLPIYTSGKITTANKVAKIELDEVNTEKNLKKDELFCTLVERYYGLALSNKVLEVREQVLETMKKHLDDAEKLKKHGMIAEAEFLHAKVYHSQALREFKKAKRHSSIVNQSLLTTLSMDTALEINPITELFYNTQIEPESNYLESAKEKSLQLKMIDYKRKKVNESSKMQKKSYLPNIVAMGTYNIADKDLSELTPRYVVGVGMNWTIFDGVERLHKIKKSQVQLNQVDDFYSQSELDIDMAINKYYQELNMQLEQLEDLDQASIFVSEYYRVRQKAFAEGMATTTEVADANLAMTKVKIEKLQAIYNYDVALAKLLFYSGKLNEYSQYQEKGKNYE